MPAGQPAAMPGDAVAERIRERRRKHESFMVIAIKSGE